MSKSLRIGLIGPLPPPSGGMANQTLQLSKLLAGEGLIVELVQTNYPYQPAWIGKVVVIRALFRLVLYIARLWKASGRVDIFHVMANSGWSWYLFAMPAVWIAKLRKVPAIINYRGGEAEQFFKKSFRWVKPTLQASARVVVPSRFLQQVFNDHNIQTNIVANIIDIERFAPSNLQIKKTNGPHLLVARNLELIYDNATAIRAFKEVLHAYPEATLTVAGTGPEKLNLLALVKELAIEEHVTFTGRVDTQKMPALYQSAQLMLNPSRVDNMPNSILESLASGVPVVSSNVGGIPFLVEHEKTALLVPVENYQAMAIEVKRLLQDEELRNNLIQAGLEFVQQFSWPVVRDQWLEVYRQASN
jgi:glycosyltransferase involved in cell wall biosynthesis